MLSLERMMFSFKKKLDFTPTQDLLDALNAQQLNVEKANLYFLQADANIVRNTQEFSFINDVRRCFHEEIGKSRHGKQWFKQSFEMYMKHLSNITSFDQEMIKLDTYLALYWYFCLQYPIFMVDTVAMCNESMNPRIRRYYEKTYNIDVFTGLVFDTEVERNNAWKEHFYKASFAYHDGKGNLEISLKEWRTFVREFIELLSHRPRLIYDFAKEVVTYQKLFQFFSYAIQIERMEQKQKLLMKLQIDDSSSHNENNSIQTKFDKAGKNLPSHQIHIDHLLTKMINAVYAVDEAHGLILKKLYV